MPRVCPQQEQSPYSQFGDAYAVLYILFGDRHNAQADHESLINTDCLDTNSGTSAEKEYGLNALRSGISTSFANHDQGKPQSNWVPDKVILHFFLTQQSLQFNLIKYNVGFVWNLAAN